MRKVLVIVIASIGVLCLAGVVAAFALAQRPSESASASQHASAAATNLPSVAPAPGASPAPPGTEFTMDATIADIPTWITPARELTRAHSIHVWLATAKCMHQLGYTDFHYRVFWLPRALTGTSENFWTNGMSSSAATKALTDEFGPKMITGTTEGCYGRADVALQRQFLDGK